jgi:hypothetical protein
MGSVYGTTEKHGAAVKAKSQSKRPATDGNKNIVTGKKGQKAGDLKKGMIKGSLKGPY